MKYRLALPIVLVLIVLAVVMVAFQNDDDNSGLTGNTDTSPDGTNPNPDISTNSFTIIPAAIRLMRNQIQYNV